MCVFYHPALTPQQIKNRVLVRLSGRWVTGLFHNTAFLQTHVCLTEILLRQICFLKIPSFEGILRAACLLVLDGPPPFHHTLTVFQPVDFYLAQIQWSSNTHSERAFRDRIATVSHQNLHIALEQEK